VRSGWGYAGECLSGIPDAFYRDEHLLSWLLIYTPPPLIALVVKATNEKAKGISWPRQQPRKHLRTGEFMRWVGMWQKVMLARNA
jgi:hypothetical protein